MNENNKKILVTGFAPFGSDSVNPSIEAVKLLPDSIENSEIVKAELPVLFGEAAEVLRSLIERECPGAVLCTGLAGGRKAITPEVVAVNLRNARIPDNAGRQPVWEKIVSDGPDGLFSTLPVREMTEVMTAEGIPAALSFSVGTFVCNDVMYRLMWLQREHFPEMKAGFVHVPYAAEYPHKEGEFSMPLAEIARGLEICVSQIVGKLNY